MAQAETVEEIAEKLRNLKAIVQDGDRSGLSAEALSASLADIVKDVHQFVLGGGGEPCRYCKGTGRDQLSTGAAFDSNLMEA